MAVDGINDHADLVRQVADLTDLEAIRALKIRYARFCDDGYDPDGIASLFVEHGVWDGGALFGRCEGTDAIRRHFQGAPARIPWALHFTLAPELALDGPPGLSRRAEGTWYLWQPCVRRSADGSEREAWLAGGYHDRYLKDNGVWRFEQVTVDARWLSGPPPTPMPGDRP
jgi:SnoaL-like domain